MGLFRRKNKRDTTPQEPALSGHDRLLAAIGRGTVYYNSENGYTAYTPTVEQAQEIAQAIREAPRLTVFDIPRVQLDDACAPIIAEALSERHDLRKIRLCGNGLNNGTLGDTGLQALLTGLKPHRNLQHFHISHELHHTDRKAIQLDTETLIRLADTLSGFPRLATIHVVDLPFDAESAAALANALADKSELSSVYFSSRDDNPHMALVSETLDSTEHPQLQHIPGIPHNAPERIKASGKFDKAVELLMEEYAEPSDPPEMFARHAYIMAYDHALAHHYDSDVFEPSGAYYDEYYENEHLFYSEQLPYVAAKDTLPHADALFHPSSDSGLCPLETPDTWLNYPDLLQQLERHGQLDAALQREPLSGGTLLQCALAFGNVQDTLDFFHARGQDILQILSSPCPEGTPSIPQIVEQRGYIGACFNAGYWKGQTTEQLQQAKALFPPESHAYIRNASQLRFMLEQEQRAQTRSLGR